jgi:hypothetical protein
MGTLKPADIYNPLFRHFLSWILLYPIEAIYFESRLPSVYAFEWGGLSVFAAKFLYIKYHLNFQ